MRRWLGTPRAVGASPEAARGPEFRLSGIRTTAVAEKPSMADWDKVGGGISPGPQRDAWMSFSSSPTRSR